MLARSCLDHRRVAAGRDAANLGAALKLLTLVRDGLVAGRP
jgi:hypothetical protein